MPDLLGHLLLLSLALLCLFEIAKTYLPQQPGIVNVVGLLVVGALLDHYVPDRYLLIGACATVVAFLDRRL